MYLYLGLLWPSTSDDSYEAYANEGELVVGENSKTCSAFAEYREAWGPAKPMHPDAERFAGDTDLLSEEGGLADWVDGPFSEEASSQANPDFASDDLSKKKLWAITAERVLHAFERCDFGTAREAGVIKHSNLTGGVPAFMGGEMILANEGDVLLNGCSGRYRAAGPEELLAAARAFARSGYRVWSMGYDDETARPALFGTSDPVRVDA